MVELVEEKKNINYFEMLSEFSEILQIDALQLLRRRFHVIQC